MRILVIEDDASVLDYISRGLRESGFTVDQAADGKDGLFRASAEKYDALVVDRMLPGVDGLAIIRTLRGADNNTPALILSALGEVDDRVDGLRAGSDDYLVKPFALSELLARVEALLRRPRGGEVADATTLRVADLELDRLKRAVRRGERRIELQPKEFQLLEYLMRHVDQVVTRTMLLEGVWDYHFDPKTNVIDVHISNLRHKVDRDARQPLIHTVRGKGDRLGDAQFGFNTAETYQPLELAFFKQHLKGGEASTLPEALVFETGANRWRRFDSWPPASAQTRKLYFQEHGRLAWSAPVDAGFDEYPADPARPVPYTQEISQRWGKNYMAEDQRFAARRPDVLVYQTEPLEDDLTLAGPLKADLWFSTSASDADIVIKLIDVAPGEPKGWGETDHESGRKNRGGQQTLVRGEPFRGRYRESYEQPLAFVPGQPARVAFPINDVFHTFKRGHRLMVQVQSSWFPFIDRNPQTFVPSIYAAKPEDFVRATHRLYRDAAQSSNLEVRVLPAADAR